MSVIVTGVAGFIGSHLTEKLLSKGYRVIGIDSFLNNYPRSFKEKNISNFLNHTNFTFINKNIINLSLKELLTNVDYIFHQAAQAGVRASWGKNFKSYNDNNILCTQKLLESVKESNIKKFIYASSSSVYGDTDKFPMKEKDKVNPVSPYGVSKLAGENLCYLYWKNYNIPVISLRYFTVFGERQRPDMAFHIFIKSILQNKPLIIYGDGKQSRNFTHVDDIVKANLLATKSDVEGEIFNIGGDGKRITINDTISLMENIIGKKADKKYRRIAKGDVRHTAADCNKAKKLLRYNPNVDFKEGLIREIKWIQQLY